ncbi:MAG: hypothetical protein ACI841_002725 [Planctomycetota bacterium]|jgi:hypothetical protein
MLLHAWSRQRHKPRRTSLHRLTRRSRIHRGQALRALGSSRAGGSSRLLLDSARVLITAPGDDDLAIDASAAYAFCHNSLGSTFCISNSNSLGGTADIEVCGSPSIADNDFAIHASVTPDQAYWFFYGTAQVASPFGDGVLCTAGFTKRIGRPRFAKGSVANREVDLPCAEIFAAGTLNFQCRYIDPPGGSSSYSLFQCDVRRLSARIKVAFDDSINRFLQAQRPSTIRFWNQHGTTQRYAAVLDR